MPVATIICLVGLALYYQSKNQATFKNSAPIPNNTNNYTDLASLKMNTEGWKTYSNSKYGYSLQYPADYKIIQFEGFGIAEPVTSEANYVKIADKNSESDQITVTGNALESLSEKEILNYFNNISANTISYSKIILKGASGYQVLFKESSFNYDYYFLQTSNGEIIKVEVLKNSDVGMSILSTLLFY